MNIKEIEKEIELNFGHLGLTINDNVDTSIGRVKYYEFEDDKQIGMMAIYYDKHELNFGLWDKVSDIDLLNVWLDESDDIKVLGIEKMKSLIKPL